MSECEQAGCKWHRVEEESLVFLYGPSDKRTHEQKYVKCTVHPMQACGTSFAYPPAKYLCKLFEV